jgi:phage terminase large subunit-like protein
MKNKENYILTYWKQIETGGVIVSKRVKRQYQKLVESLDQPKNGYHFDINRGTKPIEFIEKFCRHSKGEYAGKPLKLELFQKAYIMALFGFIDNLTGYRQYRESLFMVARKNGKSTMASGISLYMMIADKEPGAEIYSVASKKDQAKIIFDETHNMVKQSPDLSCFIRKRKSDLYFDPTFSKFEPLGKNSNSLDGLNSHLCVIDELHSIKDRNIYEVMKQSMSARRQPLMLMVTTSGTIRENIFDDIYAYACGVVDGTFEDETFLGIIYELDDKSEYKEPKMWQKANPGLGTIKKIDDLKNKIKRSENSPNDLSGILCKDFNVKMNAYNAWLTWDDINNTKTFDLEKFRGSYFIGGVDLSKTGDLTCATALLMDPLTEERFVAQMYWLPEDTFNERIEADKIPYDKWRDRGLLRLCNGNVINYKDVTSWFMDLVTVHGISPAWVYVDAWSATYFIQEMEKSGFNMIKCRQGAQTLSIPMERLGADLKAKKINYNDNTILKWCLSNTSVTTDRNDNIIPAKAKAKMKIDGTAALLDSYVGLCDHYQEFVDAI